MEKIRILLCCGAGMSSGFLASNARKAAKKKNLDVTVNAHSQSEVSDYWNCIDILLLGPHLAAEREIYKKMGEPYGIPVEVIPASVYASLDGEKLIEFAVEALQKNK